MYSDLINRIENNCMNLVKVNGNVRTHFMEIVRNFFDVPSFRMHKFEYLIRIPRHRFL